MSKKENTMPITKLTPDNNYPYHDYRLKALERVVPEAFADCKINWDTLRETPGEDLEVGELLEEWLTAGLDAVVEPEELI